jgi:glycosyltransferase involved in cell wall biosynthesis
MKYPFVLFYRDDSNAFIDDFFHKNNKLLQCTMHIINKKEKINKIYNTNYQLLVIFDKDKSNITPKNIKQEYNISKTVLLRTILINEIQSVESFNQYINEKYIYICGLPRVSTRPVFSIFTSTFNSYDKIIRAFNSLKAQTLTDWEWVIMDDSPDDKHFMFLRKLMATDNRVRLYRRSENNGCIGNVKNEAVSLCRGEYVLELDHDDEILPFVLGESAALFFKNQEIGFIYMDFTNIYENGNNYTYGDFICKGYGSYYCQKYNDKWVYVYNTPNINNITLSHLVCCPNHPRIWRRDLLLNIGNYCEYLPICDDYEILLRTAINTKIAKFPKLGYIQYMNESNNNFSLIRNEEINRIGPNFISPIYYDNFKIHEKMKELDAYEDEKYLEGCEQIWRRDTETYTHKYCNLLVNNDYKRQICIIGLNGLIKNIDEITQLYKDTENDFFILENKCSIEYLCKKIDSYDFGRMKCYTLLDVSDDLLINYFKVTYCSSENPIIFKNEVTHLAYNTKFNERHEIINSLTSPNKKYLEIGVEYGYTYKNTHFSTKVGVDPDPKCVLPGLQKYTSDDFFTKCTADTNYDVVFIDGMHHAENVLKDLNNSISRLNKNGCIFIDDIIPLNYNEQLKIPRKHHYENGVLKYGEEWTGDVWKVIYHLLLNFRKNINFGYYYNINYRGVLHLTIKEKFTILETDIDEINGYDYFSCFNHYLELLSAVN